MKKRIIPNKRSIKAKLAAGILLGLALVTGFSGVPNTRMTENPYVAEAKSKKKDKKKPVITFKDKKIKEVEQGKKVKNLGVTAKDNVDGNVTKKVKVTVKRGKKKYSTIAKKIKNNKSVEFKDTGIYKITYTVTDKAGNKATKTRTIKVVAPKKKTTETTTYVEDPTTEEITTEIPTTEITTETPTTEQPTIERPVSQYPDLPKPIVGDGKFEIHNIYINGINYEVINDPDFEEKIKKASNTQDKITINIENDYDYLMFSKYSGLIDNVEYLKFLGKITAFDENGKDLSAGVGIYSPVFSDNIESQIIPIYIYVEDTSLPANSIAIPVNIYINNWNPDNKYDENSFKGNDFKMLSKDPLVYGHLRQNISTNSLDSAKTLKFVHE